MSAGSSAAARAAALRAQARRGLWRRLLAWLGLGGRAVRRADNRAALWAHGAAAEEATARLLAQLEPSGWTMWHDMALPGRLFNLDHVLASPCGTAVVVLDTKAWRKSWTTFLVNGRVHCGSEDRHKQIEKVAGYAHTVAAALGLPEAHVRPLVVVHGSPVAGGHLEAPTPHGPVYVLSPGLLVSSLAAAPGLPDRVRAGLLAAHVGSVITPYVDRGR
ncbi:nuclease-related domain-containing protein [Streptomyces sp. NPDC060366]|uniref:nuclease-related domain-containing protein n=1 Tax=Streptomyces sp. NPDC060366 TaxID=3347105 RepID=UPI0036649B9C